MSKTNLKKLIDHLFWADKKVWSIVLQNEKAKNDEKIREMLFHSFMTQDAFAHVWLGKVFEIPQNESYTDIDSVKNYADKVQSKLQEYLKNLDKLELDKITNIPWSKYFSKSSGKTTADTNLSDTILQVVMHTTYHRGQINKRLRELDVEPPLVDYITWLWMNKP